MTPRPTFLRVVNSEAEIPFPAGAQRIHSLRVLDDGGSPWWAWTAPTKKPLYTSGGLAWFREQGFLSAAEAERLPSQYTVGIVAPCSVCQGARTQCPNHGRHGVSYELVLVDSQAPKEQTTPKATPLRTWRDFAAARQRAWHLRGAQRHRGRVKQAAPADLQGLGAPALCQKIIDALKWSKLRERDRPQLAEIRQLAAVAIDSQRRGKTAASAAKKGAPEQIGVVTAARRMQRLLRQLLEKKIGVVAKPCLELALQAAVDLERKFSRTRTSETAG